MAETLRTTKISMIVKTKCKTWDQKSPTQLVTPHFNHPQYQLHLSSCKFTIDHITPPHRYPKRRHVWKEIRWKKRPIIWVYRLVFGGVVNMNPGWMSLFRNQDPPNQSDQQLLAVKKLKQGILQGLQGTEKFRRFFGTVVLDKKNRRPSEWFFQK